MEITFLIAFAIAFMVGGCLGKWIARPKKEVLKSENLRSVIGWAEHYAQTTFDAKLAATTKLAKKEFDLLNYKR